MWSVLRFWGPMKWVHYLWEASFHLGHLWTGNLEKNTPSITQVLIHTINTFPLMCGHPVGAGFSVLNQTYLWTNHAVWQVGSETITVKCEDASMEVCEASTEDPGARLISWALWNWGCFHGQDIDVKERHSSRRWGRRPKWSQARSWDTIIHHDWFLCGLLSISVILSSLAESSKGPLWIPPSMSHSQHRIWHVVVVEQVPKERMKETRDVLNKALVTWSCGRCSWQLGNQNYLLKILPK